MSNYRLTAVEKKEQVDLKPWYMAQAEKIRKKPLNEKQRTKWILERAKQLCKSHREDHFRAAKTEKGRIAYEERAIWIASCQLQTIIDIEGQTRMFASAGKLIDKYGSHLKDRSEKASL